MLTKKIFGLDISDHSIEALVLSKSLFGKPRVESYGRTIIRGEVVKNGVIKNPKKLEELIKQTLDSAKPKPINSSLCILSLPESQVFSTIFKMPSGLKRKEIQSTIPYKAEEIIPFKSSEIYYDFKSITVEDQSQEIFYVAAPVKVVDSYVDVLRKVGIKPVAFDLESVSLARALISSGENSDGGTLIIDIGSRTTNLNIFDKNGIRQSLTIKIAGDRFTKAIVTNMKLTPKEAAEVKMKNGFDPKKQEGKALLVLQNEFKRIIKEAQSLIEYYKTETNRPIKKIILAGGSSLLPQVDQYLADNLGTEVVLGNPFLKIVDQKGLVDLKNKAVLYGNVAGAALRGISKNADENDINLLPVKFKKFALVPDRAEKKAWRLIYVRLAIFLLLLLGLGGVFALRQQGSDLYSSFYPSYNVNTSMDSNVDFMTLEELRQSILNQDQVSTTTPTTTKPIINVTIRQTSAGVLNVREGPGVSFSQIGQVPSGSVFELIQKENDWYQIEFEDDKTGWVISTFADLTEVNLEPGQDQNIDGALKENLGRIRILPTELGYLNVREGPGVEFKVVLQAKNGAEYDIVNETNGWLEVKLDGTVTGWVFSVYVDKLE